jgi:hypothetical protein
VYRLRACLSATAAHCVGTIGSAVLTGGAESESLHGYRDGIGLQVPELARNRTSLAFIEPVHARVTKNQQREQYQYLRSTKLQAGWCANMGSAPTQVWATCDQRRCLVSYTPYKPTAHWGLLCTTTQRPNHLRLNITHPAREAKLGSLHGSVVIEACLNGGIINEQLL